MLFYDKFIIFAFVRKYEVEIYGKLEEMPHLLEGDFFHSLELFQILEKTPGITPFYGCCHTGEHGGQDKCSSSSITANLYSHLIYIRTRTRMERDFMRPDAEQNAIFPLLLRSITIHLHKRLCFTSSFPE